MISWTEVFVLIAKFILQYFQERKDAKKSQSEKKFERTKAVRDAIHNGNVSVVVHSVGLSLNSEVETDASKYNSSASK